MQALILVGGRGTRLRPLTLTAPKPALTLVDRPFMRYVLDWLARHGVDDVVLACGFLTDQLQEVLGDELAGGVRLRYLAEPEPRGTAGAIRFAGDLLEDRFLALNGDVLCDLDLGRLVSRHEESGARATLALYPVADPRAYGLVRRKADGEIVEFVEKPDAAQIDTDEISAGAYVLEKDVLDLVPPDRTVSIEREVFPQLVGAGAYAERLDGYWLDIGTPERYLEACWDILLRRVDTEPGRWVDGDGVFASAEAEVPGEATIAGPAWIGSGTKVGAGARVGERAVLGPGSSVGERARVEGSALLGDCTVGSDAVVEGAILAPGVSVEEGAVVPDGAVIGAGATITSAAALGAGAKVGPGERA